MEPSFHAAVSGDDFTATGNGIFLEKKGIVDGRLQVEEAGTEAQPVEEGSGVDDPDFVDVGRSGRTAKGRGGTQFLHAPSTEDFVKETPRGTPGKAEKVVDGGKKQGIPESEGLVGK